MSLLDTFIPHYRLREIDRVPVAAPLEEAYRAIRHVDAYRLGFVRALFAMRALPEVFAAKLAGEPSPLAPHATLEDIVKPGADFHLLSDEPGKGFAVGAVGKFWEPKIPFLDTDGARFAGFDQPGWGKVAWCIEAAPRLGGGSWVSFEVRVDATDPTSAEHFARYWALIGPFSHAIRRAALSMLERELKPAPPPSERSLPGDAVLPSPKYERTRSVRIEAPPEKVWPWLVQMGCQRGGWYALDALDNGGEPSADSIHPEWQRLEEGDLLLALPDGSAAFGVLMVEPCRALVLGSPSLRRRGPKAPGAEPPFKMTWTFALEPIGSDATLLSSRVRAEFEPGPRFFLRHGWELLAHEVMQRQQLHNLTRLAEANC